MGRPLLSVLCLVVATRFAFADSSDVVVLFDGAVKQVLFSSSDQINWRPTARRSWTDRRADGYETISMRLFREMAAASSSWTGDQWNLTDPHQHPEETGYEELAEFFMSIAGPSFSFVGGTFYAISAFGASYPEAMLKDQTEGWTPERARRWFWISYVVMGTGGFLVTLGLQTGDSVPLMNAIVYSTNLVMNMVFQITFSISPYTKVMRMGTVLFAITALQVGGLAPIPEDPDSFDPWQIAAPLALVWEAIFFTMFFLSCWGILQVNSLPRHSALKQMTWAFFVGSVGAFTDNFAKINGQLQGFYYWLLLVPYGLAGIFFISLCVAAMAGCDVAVYIPAQLCIQLVMNVITDFLVWGVWSRLAAPVPYAIGFVICCFAVYIATPGCDVGAIVATFRELRSAGLSNNFAVTPFGKSLGGLSQSWREAKADACAIDPISDEERRLLIQDFVMRGLVGRFFDEEDVAELVTLLWVQRDKHYRPTPEIVEWLSGPVFFQDYDKRDPKLYKNIMKSMPEGYTMPPRARSLSRSSLMSLEMYGGGDGVSSGALIKAKSVELLGEISKSKNLESSAKSFHV